MVRSLPLALVAITTIASTVPASAQVSMAQATMACQGDVLRLCAENVPDHEAIIGCMQQRHSELSAGCAAVFDKGMRARVQKTGTGQ